MPRKKPLQQPCEKYLSRREGLFTRLFPDRGPVPHPVSAPAELIAASTALNRELVGMALWRKPCVKIPAAFYAHYSAGNTEDDIHAMQRLWPTLFHDVDDILGVAVPAQHAYLPNPFSIPEDLLSPTGLTREGYPSLQQWYVVAKTNMGMWAIVPGFYLYYLMSLMRHQQRVHPFMRRDDYVYPLCNPDLLRFLRTRRGVGTAHGIVTALSTVVTPDAVVSRFMSTHTSGDHERPLTNAVPRLPEGEHLRHCGHGCAYIAEKGMHICYTKKDQSNAPLLTGFENDCTCPLVETIERKLEELGRKGARQYFLTNTNGPHRCKISNVMQRRRSELSKTGSDISSTDSNSDTEEEDEFSISSECAAELAEYSCFTNLSTTTQTQIQTTVTQVSTVNKSQQTTIKTLLTTTTTEKKKETSTTLIKNMADETEQQQQFDDNDEQDQEQDAEPENEPQFDDVEGYEWFEAGEDNVELYVEQEKCPTHILGTSGNRYKFFPDNWWYELVQRKSDKPKHPVFDHSQMRYMLYCDGTIHPVDQQLFVNTFVYDVVDKPASVKPKPKPAKIMDTPTNIIPAQPAAAATASKSNKKPATPKTAPPPPTITFNVTEEANDTSSDPFASFVSAQPDWIAGPKQSRGGASRSKSAASAADAPDDDNDEAMPAPAKKQSQAGNAAAAKRSSAAKSRSGGSRSRATAAPGAAPIIKGITPEVQAALTVTKSDFYENVSHSDMESRNGICGTNIENMAERLMQQSASGENFRKKLLDRYIAISGVGASFDDVKKMGAIVRMVLNNAPYLKEVFEFKDPYVVDTNDDPLADTVRTGSEQQNFANLALMLLAAGGVRRKNGKAITLDAMLRPQSAISK